ncbi:hypothetical protein DUI87_11475 [Hirundo rustica rustica]|uniref:Uncharacterized protein n=1 Tax=Hirundo rustica rustica TaxID=333673 RepID=A0A3M0KDS9_HIRRU|nr:hypothetical protein DUI87_11475 [Hirundo rustica rustica]
MLRGELITLYNTLKGAGVGLFSNQQQDERTQSQASPGGFRRKNFFTSSSGGISSPKVGLRNDFQAAPGLARTVLQLLLGAPVVDVALQSSLLAQEEEEEDILSN